MTYKASVSSTYEDLKAHREYVISELRRAGVQVDPMEDWTSTSDQPKTFSQERLEGCDFCVLLVALRRGFVPAGETRSITQLEYDEARRRGLDVLVFMVGEDVPWRRQFDELDSDPQMRPWRQRLTATHGVGFFDHDPESSSPENLLRDGSLNEIWSAKEWSHGLTSPNTMATLQKANTASLASDTWRTRPIQIWRSLRWRIWIRKLIHLSISTKAKKGPRPETAMS